MFGPVLVVAALAIAAWAVFEGRRGVPDRTSVLLATFALGALALRGLLQVSARVPLLLPAAALAALVTLVALAWLAARAPRKRDLFLRMPFAAIAAITLVAGAPSGVVALFAILASLAYRWRHGLPTLRLIRLAAGALALVALVGWGLPEGAGRATGMLAPFGDFARGVRALAVAHLVFAVPVLMRAFLRDPSLGIRTVGRRLALSHVLVVGIPLALLGVLWVATTVLGVNSERARVGARALEAEAEDMRSMLRAALAEPAPPGGADAALHALTSRATEWPGLRVWRVRGDAVTRVVGDPLRHDSLLAGWIAALDSLPAAGVIELRDRVFLGAAARRGADGAVALAHVDSVLARAPSRIADSDLRMFEGRLTINGRDVIVSDDSTRTLDDEDAPADSAAAEFDSLVRSIATGRSARGFAEGYRAGQLASRQRPRPGVRVGPQPQPGARLTVGEDTIRVGDRRDDGGLPFLLQGHALVHGVAGSAEGWQRSQSMLTASTRPAEILAGLVRSTRDDPVSALPLMLVIALAISALLVALFDVVLVTSMARSITSTIQSLKVGARRLESGDLAHRIEVKGDDDLWDVADTFNQASAGLERARELEKEAERLESELALARRIQARLLPAAPPDVAGLELAGLSEPAREVGGDYYDHIPLGDGRVMLVIADVSGKGVGAALLMSAFRASLMSQDADHEPPDVLAARLNEFLHRSVDPGKFVTAFVAFLDGRDGRLVYANAGHNPPVLLRADGTHEMLETGGLILGILPGSRFECGEARLESGDLVALYTDGVTEGADASGEQWGEERLLATLRERSGIPCADLVRSIVHDVRTFEGESGPADDITLLVARRV